MESTLPKPPFLDIPGVDNFRDIGGYPICSQPGKVVRRGVVFRSGRLSEATEEGISRLRQLGITDVYDLRSKQELKHLGKLGEHNQVKEWDSAKRVYLPVFRNEDYSPEAIAIRNTNYGLGSEGFVSAYMDILVAASPQSNASKPFTVIFSHLASQASPTPVIIHCTGGKDRTGLACALILSLCGVADEVIAHEYSLTDLGLGLRHEMIIQFLMNEEAFKNNPEGARRMVRAPQEAMLGTLRKIRSEYGSVEKCVIDLGFLSEEGINQLRHNMVVDATEDPLDWEQHAKLVV
ncbi:tyrosine phosphatase [Xylariaceae sp. FL0662B]|nr:tyrosine phosphatase [Xylariaceae sp. FL0662B]